MARGNDERHNPNRRPMTMNEIHLADLMAKKNQRPPSNMGAMATETYLMGQKYNRDMESWAYNMLDEEDEMEEERLEAERQSENAEDRELDRILRKRPSGNQETDDDDSSY